MALVVFALLTGASQAWAAEVVEVRVGRHPDFTRVVFELDRSAGYRIERSDPSSKDSELIISLEAGSIPRRIQSTKSFIEQVVVEPSGTRSIARIKLARGGLRLKEMILASPPRIVLDVIAEDGSPAPTTAPTNAPNTALNTSATPAATKAAPSVKTPAKTSAPVPATKPATPIAKTTPVVKPTPAPTLAAALVTQPAPTPVARTQPSTTPAPKTKVLASTATSGAKAATSPPSAVPPTPTPSAPAGDVLAAATPGSGAASAPNEWNDGGTAAGSEDPADPNAAAEKPKSRPMMVKSSDRADAEEGGGMLTWTLAGLGLAAAAFGGLVVARRRRAAADDEDAEGEAERPYEDDAVADRSSASDVSNPFAELTGGSASLASNMTSGAASPARPAALHEKKPSESLLFDDAEEKTMENMEVISRSQVNESLGGAMPMMGAGSDELTQMFREMQRRVAALEGRIDELVDARDRLERQVAAQTEELRVQRAAIARTQRAVRNLARPEEGNDDEPTEPALRDPN